MRVLVAAVTLSVLWAGAAAAQEVRVEDPWARASIGMVPNSAAYMTIHNRGSEPERLVAVSASVGVRAELHDHVMDGEVARMQQVGAIEIPAGGTATLAPGGLHIMLMRLAEPLAAGDSIDLTLSFERAGNLEVEAEVRPLRDGNDGEGQQGLGSEQGQDLE